MPLADTHGSVARSYSQLREHRLPFFYLQPFPIALLGLIASTVGRTRERARCAGAGLRPWLVGLDVAAPHTPALSRKGRGGIFGAPARGGGDVWVFRKGRGFPLTAAFLLGPNAAQRFGPRQKARRGVRSASLPAREMQVSGWRGLVFALMYHRCELRPAGWLNEVTRVLPRPAREHYATTHGSKHSAPQRSKSTRLCVATTSP